MKVGSAGPYALVLGVVGLAGCGGSADPYTASATAACLRDHAAAASQPSRAAARELRRGPHQVRIGYVGRSGSTIGLKASGGDYQIVLYPAEEILYYHFARSDREASSLLHGYRSNLGYQIGERTAENLAYRRRNVVVEWDRRKPSGAEQRAVDACLLSKPAAATRREWRPARVPKSYSGVFTPAELPLLELVPKDAEVAHAWFVRPGGRIPPQVAVAWQRTSVLGSDLDTSGLAIWQRLPRAATWRRVYSLRFPLYRVDGVSIHTGDVNGDHHSDLLLFEDMGGSAGCGLYRLLATVDGRMRQLSVRRACYDNAVLTLGRGALVMYDGIVKDPRPFGIHCCWTVWLRTVMRWRGSKLAAVETRRTGPPPLSLRRERSHPLAVS